MTNQNNQEITKIQEQTDTDYLRRYLRQCESEIMRLSYDENDRELFILSNEDRILEQAEIRCALLNQMFELHCSEANIRDLEATNNRLVQMEAKVLEIHKQRHQQLTAIHPDYKLDTHLTYCHDAQNPQLIIREEDDFYGSQWSDMMEILDLIHGVEMTDNLYGCYDNFSTPTSTACSSRISAILTSFSPNPSRFATLFASFAITNITVSPTSCV